MRSLIPLVTIFLLLLSLSYSSWSQKKDSISILNEFKLQRFPYKNVDSSYTFFENFCLDIGNKKQWPYFVGMAYEELGIIASNKGDITKGIELYDSSYVYAVKSGDSIGMGTALNWIGISYQYQGLQNLAIEKYLSAYEIGKKMQDHMRANKYISNVASLYFSMAQFDNSLKYQRMAIAEGKSTDNALDANLARCYADIALVFLQLNQIDSAKYFNLESYKISKETGDSITMADVHLNNYSIFRNENPSYAAQELKKGTILTEKYYAAGIINVSKLVDSYMLNGSQAISSNSLSEAKMYFNKSILLAQEFGLLKSIVSSYSYLMEISEMTKDYFNAYQYASQYKKYSDSLFTIEKEKIVQENAIVFETEQKEKEIALKNSELLQTKNTIRNKNILIIATLLLILLLSLGVYFSFKNYKLKRKIEQQQVLLDERKRISTELHDDLGAQLSVAKIFLHNLKNNSNKDQDEQLIESSLGMLESSITHLRNIMNELQNTTLEEKGYIVATEELINKLSSIRRIKFNLSYSGMETRLSKKIEHQLFRATQELINNTLKYADANSISIDVVNDDKRLVFLFEDDGKGFDSEKIAFGNGLNNITSRMATLNGSVLFDTQEGKGCRTIIEINHSYN